ncbi:MAG: UDP-N-acetylmuramoyl-L-alanyl-D-glutamate--2,6-diaminopimelate ligase, partial [Deltaproteobacteria bacterium]
AHGVSRLQGVPGRLERVPNRRSLTIIVDYAHTPDALLKALTALRPLAGEGRLITVFGCGGDRDRGKRREMGQVAAQHSDLVILTSDNPRTEDPESIIAQIEPGMRDKDMEKLPGLPGRRSAVTGYFVEPDRAEAIQKAVEEADQKDIILIAGKGHEDYQIIGTQKRHFDDREVAAKAAS